MLGRQAVELASFCLSPRRAASQGEGRLSVGYICLRDSSGAIEANTVNSINFVFYTGIVYTMQTKRLHVFRRCQSVVG